MQNHLTELLDSAPRPSYSERTLQPGRTPGRGLQGARRELPVKDGRRVGRRSVSSEPTESGAPLEKAPEPQPGPFHWTRFAFRSRAMCRAAHVGRGTEQARSLELSTPDQGAHRLAW